MLKLYEYKVVLAGGVEELCEQTYKGFQKIGHLAGSRPGKEEVNCPFDKRRNGIVMGEGAVQVQGGDELLGLGLLDGLDGLTRDVHDVARADGDDVVVVEDRHGVQGRAAAVGARPEDDVDVEIVAALP